MERGLDWAVVHGDGGKWIEFRELEEVRKELGNGLGKGGHGIVDNSQVSDLSTRMEGMLLIKIVKNGGGALRGQGGIEDSVLDMVYLRCLQNSQGKEKP